MPGSSSIRPGKGDGSRRSGRWARYFPVLIFLLASAWGFPSATAAQLISPGRLSQAHAHLEGMGSCTQCHRLRNRGVDRERCLDCHQPLARRIRDGVGYHGRLREPDCGACHKEHLGKDFRISHFSVDTFPHDSTGFALKGKHLQTECRSCHDPSLIAASDVTEFKGEANALERTFLGLPTRCGDCHQEEDPHREQFQERDCSSCHDEEEWPVARDFDHSRTSYPLEGRHAQLECGACHQEEENPAGSFRRYRPLDFAGCQSCHDDPHGGELPGRCDGCHRPQGWDRVRRDRVESVFDHGVTGFPLEGAHIRVDCRICHTTEPGPEGIRLTFAAGEPGSRSYPRPNSDSCGACHLDPHHGTFTNRGCEACHNGEAWLPTEFDTDRHDRESAFRLDGAHRVTPCTACHPAGDGGVGPFRMRIPEYGDCSTCHHEDDPHEGAFGNEPCQTCHGTEAFLMETFNHERVKVREWIRTCDACHGDGQPHGDQFAGRQCGTCHGTTDFRIPEFDHSSTRFPLDGAHREVPCNECHGMEELPGAPDRFLVRYRPLDTTCSACHGGHP